MKENNEIEAVVTNVDSNGTKTFETKSEKIYKRKDLVTTAIIAFLIGAIITAGGFAISKALRRERFDRDYKQNGFQRNINSDNFENSQEPNNNKGRMNRKGILPYNNQQNNQQNNNQNPPPSVPDNQQQPNNSQQPNNNNQNNTSNMS